MRRWVVLLIACLFVGAVPARGQDDDLSRFARPFTDAEREHWAFQPVRKPAVPTVNNTAWARGEIDTFLLARLEAEGIEPAAEADRLTWLRRVYLDLIGLPPTPVQQRAFLADASPQAYERVVDDLLSRPQYGERWARHWLDVARYAESNGYERDGAKPNAWRYRDYVIRSFNDDKPFDRFLVEQLAGDEIEGSNAETQIATTFLRLGTWDDEPAEFVLDRYEQLDDVLSATATTFLAVTLHCARCHEHKFEPLTQLDYTRFLAVFEPLKRPQEVVSATHRKEFDRLVGTQEELTQYHERMQEADRRVAEVQGKIDALEQQIRERLFEQGPTDLPKKAIAAFQTQPEQRSDAQKELVKQHQNTLLKEIAAAAEDAEGEQLAALRKEIERIDAERPAEPPRAHIWYEDTPEAPETHVFVRGDPTRPSVEVGAGIPAILTGEAGRSLRSTPDTLIPEPTATSTGRRLGLARWMTGAQNPLTARVIVNRVWQWHFGDGIVRTENDFGVMGEQPTHPQLLDWLAATFVENGWRLKNLHRRIVLSSTYRMASQWNEAAAKRDPEELLHWRHTPRRLQAEVVRDSTLAVSGRLNAKMFGPSVFPPIAPEVLAGQSKPGDGWETSPPDDAARRSVYIFVKRSLLVPELEIMDFPDTTASCEQRTVSTIAPQALTFLNGDFVHEQAAAFADRLLREAGNDPEALLVRAFELALCREPSEEERSTLFAFLLKQQAQIAADLRASGEAEPSHAEVFRRAVKALCLVLLNTNEFVYVQ